jgi:ParB/RepB/Spo0J family partition protein
MTTTILSPHDLDTPHDDRLSDETSMQVISTESGQSGPSGEIMSSSVEVVSGEVITGDVVTGLLRLNLGEDTLPAIRAGLLDPVLLHDNPRNPRTTPYDLSDLLPSVTERGVRVPLLLVSMPAGTAPIRSAEDTQGTLTLESGDPAGTAIHELSDDQIAAGTPPETDDISGEQFMIVMGHRRKYAAIAAGRDQVPCWIVPDAGVAHQIADMLIENSHRTALTATEEAEAYHQLTLEGWSPDKIAAIRAVPTSTVKTALRARELPQQAQRALDQGTLTLDQAMALEEFKDSPRASDRLLGELHDQWRFKQALASEREKRDYAIAKEQQKARLVLDGVKTTGKPAGFGYDSPAVAVKDLVDADGNALDVDLVKKLPGVAAFVEKDGSKARTVVYVEDPAALGYAKRTQPRYGMSAEQAAADAERQQREAERRDQLQVAAGVRHEFLRATYGTAKAARKLYLDALRAAVTGTRLTNGGDLDDLYKALGGTDHDTLATAGEVRLRRALVAKWVCRQELNLTYMFTSTWNLDKDAAVAWYDRLISEGYPLTDVELDAYQSLTDQHDDRDDDDEDSDSDEDDSETLDEVIDEQADDGTDDAPAEPDSDDQATDSDADTEAGPVFTDPDVNYGEDAAGRIEDDQSSVADPAGDTVSG